LRKAGFAVTAAQTVADDSMQIQNALVHHALAGRLIETTGGTGIAPRGDTGACRWVMVRHADDHVHVAAVLVREDRLRRYHPRNDYLRARETCLAAEEAYGLTRTAPADRTAVPGTSRAEIEKASRRQAGQPSRVWLRRAVRTAAVASQDPETFLTRLRKGGMLVRLRHDTQGRLVGYAVAQRDDVDADGKPVWYAGRSLARDLALPQLAQRLASAPAPGPQLAPEPTEHAAVGRAERSAALTNATTAAEAAAQALATGEGEGGGIVHAAGDLLTALGQVIPERAASTQLREHVQAVAEVYDRAARTAVSLANRGEARVVLHDTLAETNRIRRGYLARRIGVRHRRNLRAIERRIGHSVLAG